ncbi:MAG: hypothetical protein WDM85_05220 [Caulobacteraceae bacterium]
MNGFALYGRYVMASIRMQLAYPASFAMLTIAASWSPSSSSSGSGRCFDASARWAAGSWAKWRCSTAWSA